MFEFNTARNSLKGVVELCHDVSDIDNCVGQIRAIVPSSDVSGEADWRTAVDLALRHAVHETASSTSCAESRRLQLLRSSVQLSVELARVQLASPTTPIVLLSDCFDALPLDGCQTLFHFVEQNVDTWKQTVFFNACKNNLLRMCNDLLRRLSRSQNTVFCGRILLFLAKFFPLSERSGLNVISEFNLDNSTAFDSASDLKDSEDEPMDAVIADSAIVTAPLDYSLYRKFWTLQDYFRNPNQCYAKAPWKAFSLYTTDILAVFDGFRDDDATKHVVNKSVTESGEHQYFAKFLTSQKLLQLQLVDPTFRRFLLIQFLILFQYLTAPVKFKSDVQVLNEEQCQWISSTERDVYTLLERTPPDGPNFAKAIRTILQREQHWNVWKNDGCPAFAAPSAVAGGAPVDSSPAKRRVKRKVGDVLRNAHAKRKYLMGHPELTRLWNVCPDNMEACRSAKRDFLPQLDSFFDESIVQLDPSNMVEQQYRLINDSQFGWRALRLLSRRSPHFFAAAQKIPNSLPEYLETILKKVASDLPKFSDADGCTSVAADPLGVTEDAMDELPAAEDQQQPQTRQLHRLTQQLAEQLAEQLQDDWRRLAPRLGFQADEMDYFASEQATSEGQAGVMLMRWLENEGDEATEEELLYVLEALKLDSPAVRQLFSPAVVGQSE